MGSNLQLTFWHQNFTFKFYIYIYNFTFKFYVECEYTETKKGGIMK
jgi:hypothetical protein